MSFWSQAISFGSGEDTAPRSVSGCLGHPQRLRHHRKENAATWWDLLRVTGRGPRVWGARDPPGRVADPARASRSNLALSMEGEDLLTTTRYYLLLVLTQREMVWKRITFAVEIRKKKKKKRHQATYKATARQAVKKQKTPAQSQSHRVIYKIQLSKVDDGLLERVTHRNWVFGPSFT